MEHRWGRRVAHDAEVQIFVDPASAGWGRLRDISVSGGFIETALKVPALSTLCLTLPSTRRPGVRVLRAIVVRDDAEGLGVEWFDGDSDAIAALMQEATTRRSSQPFASDRRPQFPGDMHAPY